MVRCWKLLLIVGNRMRLKICWKSGGKLLNAKSCRRQVMLIWGCLSNNNTILEITSRFIVIVLDLLFIDKIDTIFEPNKDKNGSKYSLVLKTWFQKKIIDILFVAHILKSNNCHSACNWSYLFILSQFLDTLISSKNIEE